MIAIVDYGVNNLASVRNAFRAAGAEVTVTSDPGEIGRAAGIVLPGIGAASAGMKQIRDRGLEEPIQQYAASGRPLFGICLGMQLLFERSEEGGVSCLGVLPGAVRLLRAEVKVPHIGWNQVELREGLSLWAGFPPDPYFYFVHSYICEPGDSSLVAGVTEYGERFASAVSRDAVWGTQFHPERSGAAGRRLLENFVAACAVAV